MADYNWDYGVEYEPEYWAGGSPTFDESAYSAPIGPGMGWDFSSAPSYQQFTGWGDPTGPGTGDYTGGEGGSHWWQNALSTLGGLSGVLGPALQAGGALAGGAIGSNASSDAARLQSNALNRGLDLQTAQWLQQQANQAPWLQAGQQALPQLMQLAGQEPPGAFQGPPSISGAGYALPQIAPTWGPQGYQGPGNVNAGDYSWTPGQGPSAANYRYTPGQTPDAAQYASGPPQLYQGAMPGTQVSQLTGQQVLDQDPGAAFRQSEARKALEGSAAARGGLLSGSTLGALQRQSQDLASQEYGNAWQRMMARDTEQYGRNWGQYQQKWGEGVTGAQLGLASNAQNFGQAMSAAQLRESVNQQAQQMGWSQAQAEAAFREQMAQGASQQGFGQALQGQQTAWQQGLAGQQYEQQQRQQYDADVYNRMMAQSQLQYGRDTAQNDVDYQRQLAQYNSQQQNQTTQWNRLAGLAGVGQTAANQLGETGAYTQRNLSSLLAQLGTAQAGGATNQANSWMNALQNIGSSVQGGLQNNALLSALSSLNR